MAMEIACRIPGAHAFPILCVAYNQDRKEIFSGSEDTKIKVWDVETGRQLRIQQGHQAWVTDLLYSAAASLLFSCSLDGNVLVWSDKGKLLQMVEFGGPVHCLAWDTKGKHLIAGGTGFDKCICMFNSAKPAGSIMQISNCHEGAISSATYDKDTKSLVTGSYDGCLKLWSHEGHCLDTFNNLTDCITSIAYIPQTKCYWVTGKERCIFMTVIKSSLG